MITELAYARKIRPFNSIFVWATPSFSNPDYEAEVRTREKIAEKILITLNEDSPKSGSTDPQLIFFNGEFTSAEKHPNGPLCPEMLAKGLVYIQPKISKPLPAGIFPGL